MPSRAISSHRQSAAESLPNSPDRGSSDERTIDIDDAWIKRVELPAGVAELRYWDRKLTGFGVRVGRRWRTFFAARRVGSKWTSTTIGHYGRAHPDGGAATWTVRKARDAAMVLLGSMKAGQDPHAEKRAFDGLPTLRQALDAHLDRMRTGRNRRQRECSPRSIQTLESEVTRLLKDYLDKPLTELTPASLQHELSRIEASTKPRPGAVNEKGRALTNRLLAQVSAIWNTAERAHDDLPRNPAKRIGLAALKPRDERIPHHGFTSWYAKVDALGPVKRELHLMALFTALRSESLRHLRWSDIDDDQGLLRVAKAKGGRSYVVPLLATHRELLDRLRAGRAMLLAALEVPDDGGWIFPTRTRSRPFRVEPLVDPAVDGLPGLHDLRRTFISVAAEVGVSQTDREQLAGHAASGINATVYTRPEDWRHLRACAERVEAGLWSRIKQDESTGRKGRAKRARRG